MKSHLFSRPVAFTMIGVIALVLIATAVWAFASSPSTRPSLTWHDNSVRTRTCANGATLTNSDESTSSETITCGPKASSTTTTVPVSTTTMPTTTTTTTQPGGTCTDPIDSSSNAQASFNVDDGHDWVSNDAWSGSHGPQTINVCSASSWDAVSNQPNNGGQVETYPDVEYDVGGRSQTTSGVNSTTPISGFTSITSTFAESNPSDGGWDAGYDLWTNTWTNETMLWNQWAGSQAFWATAAPNTPVMLGGVPYHFHANGTNCSAATEKSCEYIFTRDTQVSSGSVDVLAAWNWEVANGFAKSTDIPTQIEYGTEVAYTSGAETFNTTGFGVSLAPTQGAILSPGHKTLRQPTEAPRAREELNDG